MALEPVPVPFWISVAGNPGQQLPVQSDPPDFENDDPRAQKPYEGTAGPNAPQVQGEIPEAYDLIYQDAVNETGNIDFSGMTAERFLQDLTTVQQAAFLRTRSDFTAYFDAAGTLLSGPPAAGSPPAPIAVMMSENGESAATPAGEIDIYVISQMQKTDFARLTPAEQARIAGSPAFLSFAASIGLLPRSEPLPNPDPTGDPIDVSTVELARAAVVASIDQKLAEMTGLPAEDLAPFREQVEDLRNLVQNMAIFAPRDIERQIEDVMKRFERAKKFFDAIYDLVDGQKQLKQETVRGNLLTTPDFGQAPVIISLVEGINEPSNNGTLVNGYNTFIFQEGKIAAELAKRRAVANAVIGGLRMDVPTLIMRLQQFMNETVDAVLASETEEINQQNALLTTYSLMQDLVNQTLKRFVLTGDEADTETRRMVGTPITSLENPSLEDRTIMMFTGFVLGSPGPIGDRAHPLEEIPRPTQDNMAAGGLFLKTAWEKFGTQLSDAVTTINQETQIKMNDINTLDRQKNRHFDLANNALRKLADTLQSIARS